MKIGDCVAWNWGSGMAEGKIKDIRSKHTQITSNGKSITRNGSKDDPAVIIEHKSGHDVLKLAHEVQVTK